VHRFMTALKLRRLRRERKRSAARYATSIKAAKDRDDVDALIAEATDVRDDIEDAILHFSSLDLIDKAKDLGIPYPSYQQQRDSWEEGREPGTVHLSKQAQLHLKQAIRTERRERWAFAASCLRKS
jgi:hypothetical protein